MGCTVTIAGFDTEGTQVAIHSFIFVPTGSLQEKIPANGDLKFSGLQTVTFTTKRLAALLPGQLVSMLMDNAVYTIYQAVGWVYTGLDPAQLDPQAAFYVCIMQLPSLIFQRYSTLLYL